MYQGKYRSSGKQAKKRSRVLLISLVMLAVISIGGTLAYLMTGTGAVTNTFTPAKVEITPGEDKTDNSKSNIQFKNSGDVPVYIRATLVIYWKDSEGKIVPQPDGGEVKGGTVQNGWTLDGEIYYYDSRVSPEDSTGIMLSPIEVTCPDGYTCHIDVRAEAIQADGLGDDVTTAQQAFAKAAATN